MDTSGCDRFRNSRKVEVGCAHTEINTACCSVSFLPVSVSTQTVDQTATADDPDLKVIDNRLIANGEVKAQSGGSVAGKVIRFYLPGHGRSILSKVIPTDNRLAAGVGGRQYDHFRGGQPAIRMGLKYVGRR